MPVTELNRYRARSCWLACVCGVLFFAALPGAGFGEVGVVSQCQLPVNTSGFGVPIGVSPYPQPVTFNVGVNGIVPQRLEAQTSPNAIEITMSGGQAPAPQVSGCGSIGINPVPPGTYEVRLYAVRGGQPAVLVSQRSLDLGAIGGSTTSSTSSPSEPSPPQPVARISRPPSSFEKVAPPPPAEFAATQPVGEIPFQHSVSLDGAAQVVDSDLYAPWETRGRAIAGSDLFESRRRRPSRRRLEPIGTVEYHLVPAVTSAG